MVSIINFFSSPEPKAHSIPMLRRPSVRRRTSPTISNIFSETACPIKAKFYVEPPWVCGTKVCSRHLGHMTKMATTPIYGKNIQKSSTPEPAGRFSQNLVCSIRELYPIIVSSNDDPGVTSTYFTARSNLVTWAFYRKK